MFSVGSVKMSPSKKFLPLIKKKRYAERFLPGWNTIRLVSMLWEALSLLEACPAYRKKGVVGENGVGLIRHDQNQTNGVHREACVRCTS